MPTETQGYSIVSDGKAITIGSHKLEGFVQTEQLKFNLHMCVTHFDTSVFVPCGEASNWLYIATHDKSALLMVSFSLWSFLKFMSHEGAYGSEGIGYLVVDVDGSVMVIIKKIAIDVEQLIGYYWSSEYAFFTSHDTFVLNERHVHGPSNFRVPYG